MDIRVLGPVDVIIDGRSVPLGGRKQVGLLGLLAVAAPHTVPLDSLIHGIWGADASPSVKSSLQTYVWNLRRVVGDVLVHERGGYRLDVVPEVVDAVRFSVSLERARATLATDPGGTATRLREALGWWRGRPFADLTDIPGLEREVRRLEELRLEAVELRLDAELALGRHSELVAEVAALAEEYPLRERFRAQHMLALYRSGRQGEALRAFRRTESFLTDELGVDPSDELRDLELRILEQDAGLLAGASRVVTQRLAFLVTDIEGSTRMWDRFPQGMASALARHDQLLGDAISAAGGRVFKHTGDGMVAVFGSSLEAAAAAETAQRGLAGEDWGEVGEVRVRMGIDVGEAESRGDDFYGPPLNRAARLCAVGHGGQVLMSAAAHAEVIGSSPPGVQVRQLGEKHLKGMATPERISQLVFVGLPADFPELRTDTGGVLDDRESILSLPGYEIRERIGEGAFGMVYRAYQPSVGREVAVKVIRPELAAEPSFVRRFEAEARTIARLAHPHIVPLIDYWRDGESAYLVMGLLPGGSLAAAITSGSVGRTTARRILSQVGLALDHSHGQGLPHGDLKPSNVLLDGAGNAYLADFGIASRLIDSETVSSLSSEPRFRAPERDMEGPSPAADVFSLGQLARVLVDGAPEIEAALARATAANPGDRYPSAMSFIADLEAALGEEPIELERPAVSRNPYKGLRAFDEGDAADFHGRADLVAALVAAVERHRLVTVVGPSGSGKSSVVRAGLLPALAEGAVDGSEAWFRVVLTPGADPVKTLEEALERLRVERPHGSGDSDGLDPAKLIEGLTPGGDLFLVVDQFEEVWTLTEDPERRRRFIDLLVGGVTAPDSHLRVVATLRADFYDRPLEEARLGRLVRDGLVTVLPPTREELVEMIVTPAQAVGLRWEPGLPHRIAEDVAHQTGGLPLLQYALTELVERRSGDLLTAGDYTRIGGVTGALVSRAEAIYQGLGPARQEATRQLLLRLVTVDEDTDDVRRRVRRAELESIGIPRADLDAVIDRFTVERLLLADRDPATRGPTVEVAHEALLREWPRLRAWIDDQRESLILGRRFRAALAEWAENRQDDGYLLTGTRLAPFTGWAETAALTLEERAYYRASRERDEKERLARRRRRRTLTGILAVAALAASTLGVVAAFQAQRASTEAETARLAEAEAEREAERAEQAADLARARELAAAAQVALDTDPSLAKLLAVASLEFAAPTLDTVSVLHRVFAADRVIDRYQWPEEYPVLRLSAALHPDGTRLVAAGSGERPSSHLEVYDFDRGEVVWSWDTADPTIVIGSPFFAADGDWVVAGVNWQPDPAGEEPGEPTPNRNSPVHLLGAHVWDANTGELLHRIDLGRCGGLIYAMAGGRLLAGTTDQPDCFTPIPNSLELYLVDVDSGDHRVVTPRSRWEWPATLSSDGRFVAFTEEADGTDATTVVLDLLSGDRVLELGSSDHPGPGFPYVQALDDAATRLVVGDRPIAVWDVESGQRISHFTGHQGASGAYVFSPDGASVYSVGQERSLRRWRTTTGAEVAVYQAVGGGRASLGGEGRVLVTDPTTLRASLLDTATRGEVWSIPTCGGFVLSGTLQVGGHHSLVNDLCPGDLDRTTYVIDLVRREIVNALPGGLGQGLAVSPDGSRFVRQEVGDRPAGLAESEQEEYWVGPLRVRDTVTGNLQAVLEGVCTWDDEGVFPPSEQEWCTEYPDTPFAMWNWLIVWSPDSKYVASTSYPFFGGQVMIWDADSGALAWMDHCPNDFTFSFLFAPDSSEFVYSCGATGRLVAVSTETWQVRSVDLEPSVDGWDRMYLVGYTADASALVAVGGAFGGGGSLHWLDAATLQPVGTGIAQLHDGSPKSFAMSPDRSLLATGSSDGYVKVWDLIERRLHQEIHIGPTEVQGVAFTSDRHVAVAPQTGGVFVYTLDPRELAGVVRRSLTRGFTTDECDRFGFSVDECPTLEEMRRG